MNTYQQSQKINITGQYIMLVIPNQNIEDNLSYYLDVLDDVNCGNIIQNVSFDFQEWVDATHIKFIFSGIVFLPAHQSAEEYSSILNRYIADNVFGDLSNIKYSFE